MNGKQIDNFLRRQKSPLVGLGAAFVKAGKRHGVDPRLLVAISGAESDFGKQIKPGTNNPFGWGPHIPFPSFADAIDTVARGLRRGYLDEGRTSIKAIGEKWAPRGVANDPTDLNANWAGNVSKFYRALGGQAPAQKIMGGRAAPVVQPTSALPIPAPKAGNPPAAPSLLGDVFRSNNELLGLDTPSFVTDLLSKLAAPSAAPVPPPSAGAPAVPQEHSTLTGFVPEFQQALDKLLKATGLSVTSGFRSVDRQRELWDDAVRKYGSEAAARKWVAPPGRSKHNHGVAADLGGNLSVLNDSLLRKYGLYRPMSWEPWHVELIGSRG